MDRHIDFDGIENFRDFGGYATACGRGLKPATLYRSAHHATATDADLRRLAGLSIAVVVDLRRKVERNRDPSKRHDGFRGQVIENDLGVEHDPWVEAIRDADLTPDWFRRDSLAFYQAAPTEERHVDLFTRYFQALATAEGPVLVHCAAGKDRTGMLCALTHHIAGVHRDDLLADYLLTNDETRIGRRMPFLAQFIRELSGRTPPDEAVRVALSVEPGYLQTAFAAMEDAYGSLDGYLEGALGVTPALRTRIEAQILA
jgi:protein tyrosine/serine phosphatase